MEWHYCYRNTIFTGILIAVCAFSVGCGSKDKTDMATNHSAKPTAVQAAAAQHGLEQGPAIAAANAAGNSTTK